MSVVNEELKQRIVTIAAKGRMYPGADPDFKFDFGKAFALKLGLTSFLKIHKLSWKSKILVHGHVRVLLNFATFPLIVLIKLLTIFFSKLALLLIINRL